MFSSILLTRSVGAPPPVLNSCNQHANSRGCASVPLPPHPLTASPGRIAARGGDKRAQCTSVAAEQQCEIPGEIRELLSPEEMEILMKNEVPDLNKLSTRKWNAVHSCALSLQIRVMDTLIGYGLHIDGTDMDGSTALHKAIIGKKEAVISHLLRLGANPHAKDKSGATPLHYAVQVGAIQTVKLLIKCKVDVNVADNEGWTPLHIAIQGRSRDIAKVLLINGADKTRRNKNGKSALDIALCYGKDFKSYELAKLLKILPVDRIP